MDWNQRDAVASARRVSGRVSQEELADRLTAETGKEWTRDMIANLENGRRSFSVDDLLAICKVLEVPVTYILFGPAEFASSRDIPRYRKFPRKVTGINTWPLPEAGETISAQLAA